MTALAITNAPGQTDISRAGIAAMEAYVAAGDIERLAPRERVALYRAVCDSLGLNPLTQPFQYLRLSGKTILYATKSCTEQLRMIHGVSVLRMERAVADDLLTVTVSVRERTGREDISTGVVSLAGLRGDALANQAMKCETKAKRRATLSICGLAMLDETEIETIRGAERVDMEAVHGVEEPAAAPAVAVSAVAEAPKASTSAGGRRRGPSASEREALLSPVPKAQKAPEVAARIEVCTTEATILPNSEIKSAVTRSGAQVWCAMVSGFDGGILIDDAVLHSLIDANAAFGVTTFVEVAQRSDKPDRYRVVRIIGDDATMEAR